MNNEQRLFAETVFAQNLNVLHHAYVDIADGNINAGLLLSQILYWFAPDKNGVPRVRVERDGIKYLVKGRTDWFDECRLSPKQFDNAAKILKAKKFIDTKTMKFNGNPTTHISINAGVINAAIDAWKAEQVAQHFPSKPKEEPKKAPETPENNGFYPNGNNEIPGEENPFLPKGEEPIPPEVNNDVPPTVISSYTENTFIDLGKEHTLPNGGVSVDSSNTDFQNHLETKRFIDEEFEKVWKEYPKKEGKQKARIAFEKAIRGMTIRKPNGEPWTSAEIFAEVVLFRQYVMRRVDSGELEYRYIPTGGSWFESERWNDEIPTISSSFDDMFEGMMHNQKVSEMRRCARIGEVEKMQEIAYQMPY